MALHDERRQVRHIVHRLGAERVTFRLRTVNFSDFPRDSVVEVEVVDWAPRNPVWAAEIRNALKQAGFLVAFV